MLVEHHADLLRVGCHTLVLPPTNQMTAFVAMVTMDANRQKAGKIDWCCCFTSKKYLEEQVCCVT